eukprot:PhM_4_TR18483/c0_g1_i2/m.65501
MSQPTTLVIAQHLRHCLTDEIAQLDALALDNEDNHFVALLVELKALYTVEMNARLRVLFEEAHSASLIGSKANISRMSAELLGVVLKSVKALFDEASHEHTHSLIPVATKSYLSALGNVSKRLIFETLKEFGEEWVTHDAAWYTGIKRLLREHERERDAALRRQKFREDQERRTLEHTCLTERAQIEVDWSLGLDRRLKKVPRVARMLLYKGMERIVKEESSTRDEVRFFLSCELRLLRELCSYEASEIHAREYNKKLLLVQSFARRWKAMRRFSVIQKEATERRGFVSAAMDVMAAIWRQCQNIAVEVSEVRMFELSWLCGLHEGPSLKEYLYWQRYRFNSCFKDERFGRRAIESMQREFSARVKFEIAAPWLAEVEADEAVERTLLVYFAEPDAFAALVHASAIPHKERMFIKMDISRAVYDEGLARGEIEKEEWQSWGAFIQVSSAQDERRIVVGQMEAARRAFVEEKTKQYANLNHTPTDYNVTAFDDDSFVLPALQRQEQLLRDRIETEEEIAIRQNLRDPLCEFNCFVLTVLKRWSRDRQEVVREEETSRGRVQRSAFEAWQDLSIDQQEEHLLLRFRK